MTNTEEKTRTAAVVATAKPEHPYTHHLVRWGPHLIDIRETRDGQPQIPLRIGSYYQCRNWAQLDQELRWRVNVETTTREEWESQHDVAWME